MGPIIITVTAREIRRVVEKAVVWLAVFIRYGVRRFSEFRLLIVQPVLPRFPHPRMERIGYAAD